MPVAELLTDLRRRGIRLWSRDGGLYVAPKALLVEADRAAITPHVPALLALLADLEALERDGTAAQLRRVAEGLTPDEHHRLAAEAAAGDRLAALMVAVLSTPRERVEVVRCRCGGIAWEPDLGGLGERCAACGAWSPCSVGAREVP